MGNSFCCQDPSKHSKVESNTLDGNIRLDLCARTCSILFHFLLWIPAVCECCKEGGKEKYQYMNRRTRKAKFSEVTANFIF